MKKKLVTMCLVVALAATAVVGGTLAYFTDTDTATNEFTVGGVKIDLVEKDEEGEPWKSEELMPGENNAVVKDVTVKNVGANAAYMWVEMWIPTALDDGAPTHNASLNNLHWNNFNTYKNSDGEIVMCRVAEANAKEYELVAETQDEYLGVEKVGDVDYTGYRLWIKNDGAKAKDESTASLLYRVFMDQRVKQCTEHEDCLKLVNGDCYTGTWKIIVNAFGIQAEGLSDMTGDGAVTVEDAIKAYDGTGAGKPVA